MGDIRLSGNETNREEKHGFEGFFWDAAEKLAWRHRHFKTVHPETINRRKSFATFTEPKRYQT